LKQVGIIKNLKKCKKIGRFSSQLIGLTKTCGMYGLFCNHGGHNEFNVHSIVGVEKFFDRANGNF